MDSDNAQTSSGETETAASSTEALKGAVRQPLFGEPVTYTYDSAAFTAVRPRTGIADPAALRKVTYRIEGSERMELEGRTGKP